MPSLSSLVALTASLVSLAAAAAPRLPLPPRPPLPPRDPLHGPTNASATFQQLIDHNHPELGTFSQRYWWNDEFWKGPGSPVVLFTPGEEDASGYVGYLKNTTITGLIAQTIGGAVIVLEHRYWGQSSPYDSLTTKNLQYLTLKQSIADLTYFAKTVKLPFDRNGSSNADKAPWVLSGGSYSGALSAWTASTSPGTFWAYHASSAPVEAIYDYWQYFAPVQDGLPANCSKDLSRVVDYIDSVLQSGNATAKQQLKDLFGLGALEHDDDFASALENGPWLWQSNSFYDPYPPVYEFCDYVENAYASPPVAAGPDGVGLEKALSGYATWWNKVFFPGYCATYGYWSSNDSIACFDTYNQSSPMFTDLSVSNTINRQWNWFCATSLSSTGRRRAQKRAIHSVAPRDGGILAAPVPALLPGGRRLHVRQRQGQDGGRRECVDEGMVPDQHDAADLDERELDPWRSAGVSSKFRPGGPLQSTPQAPLQLIPEGVHCYDLILKNAEANAGVQRVVTNEVAQIKAWVNEYYRK
ncbi:serine peptidase [Rasamsonia emersonii CBS 393.64]|uniref:Serine peptidase n=1 Tax=Rasamsonia emersonii (strain ATCC 16479 / CBS 393.64 / IMI 116815) TaxID=1408163 RepID=A0A0F4YPF6_RASE3|nr:serine peptidase [Rasamsonia emersonii CBS 393.64]KKA19721.1 serine peptidase [Rasamsonia emersonii CBS 393.64]